MFTKMLWGIFLLGLFLGPGLGFYSRTMSGRTVQEVELFGPVKDRASGSIKRQWQTPVTVHLDPSMNPIAFDFGHSVTVGTFGRTDTYSAELSKDGQAVWSKNWNAGFRRYKFGPVRIPKPIHSWRLNVFNVPSAGDYQFQMEKANIEGAIQVMELKLQVRAGVYQQEPALFWIGLCLCLGPAAYGFYWLKRGQVE